MIYLNTNRRTVSPIPISFSAIYVLAKTKIFISVYLRTKLRSIWVFLIHKIVISFTVQQDWNFSANEQELIVQSTDTSFKDRWIIALFKILKINVLHCFSQSKKKRMEGLKEQLKDKDRKLSSKFIATANCSCFKVAFPILLLTVLPFQLIIMQQCLIVSFWSQGCWIRSLCSYVLSLFHSYL